MKHAIFTLFAATIIAASSGCASVAPQGCAPGCDGNCNQCGLQTAFEEAQRRYGETLPPQQADGVVIRGNCGPDGCETGCNCSSGRGLLGGVFGGGSGDCGPACGRGGNGGRGILAGAAGGRFAGSGFPANHHTGGIAAPGREYGHTRQFNGPPGPATAAITYPYYTTRAPRCFFLDNPPTIGP